MADCTSLLDEELSSFVFNYLTENTGSQYEEEEVCSDRLDTDFPDIDLSQLDASDFDSVNCLSELQWCNDHSDTSPASNQYSTGDPELFGIEEENAALLAALTDSLDGMVEDEVGGLSVFPSLGEGAEGEEDPSLLNDPFPAPPSPETEDPSLLKKLLLSPANVPVSYETHKQGSTHRHSNGNPNLKPQRPSVKSDSAQDHKPRFSRPKGRTCTELHRHLTTTQAAEDAPSPDTEGDSESEEDSDSEGESPAVASALPQFSSEAELHSVVELIKYMHTYCLPTRKHPGLDRRDREGPGSVRRARPECVPTRLPPQSCPKPMSQTDSCGRPRSVFVRKREVKGHSLLRELLETVTTFDVSKPYRLHSPPYSHCKVAVSPASPKQIREDKAPPAKPELKDSISKGLARDKILSSGPPQPKTSKSPKKPEEASFSVRRSRRLASFPGRFGKKTWVGAGTGRGKAGSTNPGQGKEEAGTADSALQETPKHHTSCVTGMRKSACGQNEKRACLCLPLTPKSTGDSHEANKSFEQTLSVELCGTAGLTPPTTPPHKPVEDDLFKPEVKGESPPKSPWLPAGGGRLHSRKLPEQTELYAHLRKSGQGSSEERLGKRTFGDHDYCLLSSGESRKRTAVVLSPCSSVEEEKDEEEEDEEDEEGMEEEAEWDGRDHVEAGTWVGSRLASQQLLSSKDPEPMPKSDGDGELGSSLSRSGSLQALSPRNAGETSERSSRPPTPNHHTPRTPCCQPRPASGRQSFSCENSETCHGEKQRNKVNDDCRVFYIHNLPSSVTQTMLRRRFEAFGEPEECKVIVKNNERCGVITYRQVESGPGQRKRREPPFQISFGGLRRFCRKRYIDLDEAGPGPVKSKYDAMDFDTLLKEAQKSLHR
ncbi:peroxisome proliferator-activated receptor gamma coactivator 1-beta isoform X1 [Amia ocellicauda]|uniref:peroxisome proliferator-activated receptor gamma coactivator 1-beta isoform X1 n=1 Tax=Amia ocellicauda TaxID=2972642 RepID=UPI003463CEB4